MGLFFMVLTGREANVFAILAAVRSARGAKLQNVKMATFSRKEVLLRGHDILAGAHRGRGGMELLWCRSAAGGTKGTITTL